MIAYIRGRLEYVEPEEGTAVLEAGGIGYRVYLSGRDLELLPEAGQALEIITPRFIGRSSLATSSETISAPSAVSLTAVKPMRRSAAAILAAGNPLNSLTHDGASEAYTGASPPSSCRTRPMSSRTFFACAGQTSTQCPQAMHSSGITVAWPPSTLIAFTGQ